MKCGRALTVGASFFLCGFGLLVTWGADPPEPTGRTFTDVTEESGVAQVLRSHYADTRDWWLSGMDLVDLDGDGDLDLFLSGHGTPAAAAYNDGKGHFTYVDPKSSIPRGVKYDQDVPYPGGEIRLAHDFNEDGKVDLLISWHDDGGVFYLNDSRAGNPPTWNFKRTRLLDVFCRSCAMADMNRDGRLDFVCNNSEGRSGKDAAIRIMLRKEDGTFGERVLIPGSNSAGIPVDIDGDGDLDIVMPLGGGYEHAEPGTRLLVNDGKMHFTNVTGAAGLSETDGHNVKGAGDVDLDGDLDLICLAKDPAKVTIWLNDGKGHFTRKADAVKGLEAAGVPQYYGWGGAVVTDFNNDGIPDIIINGRNFMWLLWGTGGGNFEYANKIWGVPSAGFSAVDEGLCFGDIDADGKIDLVTCNPNPGKGMKAGVFVFRNALPPKHWINVRPVGLAGNKAAASAKIRLYAPGTRQLLAFEQVAIWGKQSMHSYYATVHTERHFGLGDRTAVDVSVEFYPSGKKAERKNVKADATVEIHEGGSGN